MPSARPYLLHSILAIAACAMVPNFLHAQAQDAEHDWEKTYSVAGKPSLTLD